MQEKFSRTVLMISADNLNKSCNACEILENAMFKIIAHEILEKATFKINGGELLTLYR